MGGAESKGAESQHLTVFSEKEKLRIQKLYCSIIGNQKVLTEPFLKKYLPSWLPPDISNTIYYVVCHCEANKHSSHGNKHITEVQFASFLTEAIRGTYAEKADLLFLFSGSENRKESESQVTTARLYQVVFAIIKSYMIISKSDPACQTWKCDCADSDVARMSSNLLGIADLEEVSKTESKSCDEIEAWISKCSLFSLMFDRVFSAIFDLKSEEDTTSTSTHFLMPVVTNVNWSKMNTVLDTLSVSYINYHIPRSLQSTWRLLFSNHVHGDSFSQLLTYICQKGPNVIVVRDKDGCVFGAYLSEGWELKSQFYGSSDCFIFTLHPQYNVYTATGYNENFMYLNQGQQTLPNGLGIGGQLDYFGLWIDQSFNHGHSKAGPKCTTYGSPQLSVHAEFAVDVVEVWGVGPEKKHEDDSDEDERDEWEKTSALDKNPGAKAILEMIGKPQISEGIREISEDEPPMTEEMKRKMNVIPKMM